MMRPVVVAAFLFGFGLISCGDKSSVPVAEQRHATVFMRDGTRVGGTVVATSATEMKITGDDGVSRTIPMAQVRSVDYDEAAAAPAAAPKGAGKRAAPPSGSRSTSVARSEADRVHEYHEHPAESAITTRTYELPVGTEVSVRAEETIDSSKAVEGQTFAAEAANDVTDAAGDIVIPRGANAQIIIRSASKGGRIRGTSDLVLDLQSVAIDGREYQLSTSNVEQRGKSGIGANKRTAVYTGGGAALGAIIGAIAGGGRGAAIGAGAGAGAGAVTQILTKGGSIRVPAETILTFKLDKPLRVVAAR